MEERKEKGKKKKFSQKKKKKEENQCFPSGFFLNLTRPIGRLYSQRKEDKGEEEERGGIWEGRGG